LNIAHELFVVFGGDLGNPSAHVGRINVGNEQRAMNDDVRFQLALEVNGISDGDRELCPELQPLFSQVQDIADNGVSIVFQEGTALDGEAELAALFSHRAGLSQ
jgi:hypothetical protein